MRQRPWKNKLLAWILSVVLLVSLSVPAVLSVEETLSIGTADEFMLFVSSCSLDNRYDDRTVRLRADIDLSSQNFAGIPTFSGTFDGNGHTISGISMKGEGTNYGLFRYLQKTAVVENLTVKGTYEYTGSQSQLGGIAGKNEGIIRNCSFSGTIRGKNAVGGIAGCNTESGQLLSCKTTGILVGETSVGGMAGLNSGMISSCVNRSSVNSVDEEYKRSFSHLDVDMESTVENIMMSLRDGELNQKKGVTDAGGIAGFSDGVLQGCKNYGTVGYSHIGYNVGGICGRQSGYLLGCQNYGNVSGRKDVGGIVGQAEPHVLLTMNGVSMETFRTELESLNSLVNELTDRVDSSSDKLGTHLKNISQYSKDASEEAQSMMDDVSGALEDSKEFINRNLEEINTKAALLSDAVDQLVPVLEGMDTTADALNDAIDELIRAVESLDIQRPDTNQTVADMTEGLRKLSDSMDYLKRALESAREAVEELDDAFNAMDWGKINTGIDKLSGAVRDMGTSADSMSGALASIRDILVGGGTIEELPNGLQDIVTQLSVIIESLQQQKQAFRSASDAIALFLDGIYVDYLSLGNAADDLRGSMNELKIACDRIGTGLSLFADALEAGHLVLSDYFDDVSGQLEEFSDHIILASEHMQDCIDSLSDAVQDIAGILKTLSEGGPLELSELDADYAIDNTLLFDALNGIGNEMDALRDSTSDSKDELVEDIHGVVNQFDKIMNLFLDEVDALTNRSENGGLLVDISEEDLERTKQGKVAQCGNYAVVDGDRNVGGIVGSMAIEYSLDPEDDYEKPDSFNYIYNTKAVLQSCVNEGSITGKKDCVGGIVGSMSLGTVYQCESYADVESVSGTYVGGIAGYSDSSIRKCFAKGDIAGLQKVGGIAGRAANVSGCYTIVNVSADETKGALIGEDVSRDGIAGNYFLDKGLGAIDAVSYHGHAEPITYEEILTLETIPPRFIRFNVLFVAGGRKVARLTVEYDTPVSALAVPGVPNRDGYFAAWEDFPESTVTGDMRIEAVYTPWVVSVESEARSGTGIALALAEGKFRDTARLIVTESEAPEIPRRRVLSCVYTLSLEDDSGNNTDGVGLRLLNQTGRHAEILYRDGDRWIPVSSETRGRYECFIMTGKNIEVCFAEPHQTKTVVLWIIAGGTVIVLAAALLLIRKHKKK